MTKNLHKSMKRRILIAASITTILSSGFVVNALYDDYKDQPVLVAELAAEPIYKAEVKPMVQPVAQPVVEVKKEAPKRTEQLPSRGEQREITMRVLATAYTPYDEGNSGTGLARDGKPARPYRTIAVDPSIIPLGSKVYVPGWGWGIAHDTGGAINGHHIDVCVETAGQANKWGRKYVDVKVILPEK